MDGTHTQKKNILIKVYYTIVYLCQGGDFPRWGCSWYSSVLINQQVAISSNMISIFSSPSSCQFLFNSDNLLWCLQDGSNYLACIQGHILQGKKLHTGHVYFIIEKLALHQEIRNGWKTCMGHSHFQASVSSHEQCPLLHLLVRKQESVKE